MNLYIEAKKQGFTDAIEHFKSELSHIRSGHATPELVEGLLVNAYETMTPVTQLATITVPEPKTLMIQPWDKAILKEIEKAIAQSNLGFSPVNDGEVIRIPMPPLTEENRKDLVKIIKEKAEKSRISIRGLRDKVKESIIEAEKDKSISEDDRFRFLKVLDEFTSDHTKQINALAESKEEKLMTI